LGVTNGHGTDGHGTDGHGTDGHGTDGHGTDGHGTEGNGSTIIGRSGNGGPKDADLEEPVGGSAGDGGTPSAPGEGV
ncbi:MAG: cell wall anchor protein, partial [Actinomycetota bacterium]|nr:cell wall anchor protein [Actinomycetota bacterium]